MGVHHRGAHVFSSNNNNKVTLQATFQATFQATSQATFQATSHATFQATFQGAREVCARAAAGIKRLRSVEFAVILTRLLAPGWGRWRLVDDLCLNIFIHCVSRSLCSYSRPPADHGACAPCARSHLALFRPHPPTSCRMQPQAPPPCNRRCQIFTCEAV